MPALARTYGHALRLTSLCGWDRTKPRFSQVFDDLHWIEGVLFLSNEPPGLTLLPELRTELSQLSK